MAKHTWISSLREQVRQRADMVNSGFVTNPEIDQYLNNSLGDLYDKIQMTMPALNPGSLTPEQTADLIALMLSTSKYPAGKADLAPKVEALQQIKIDAPKN